MKERLIGRQKKEADRRTDIRQVDMEICKDGIRAINDNICDELAALMDVRKQASLNH